MKVLVGLVALVAVVAAQESQQAQYGLRDFIQHLMSLEQRQQGARQGDDVLVSNEGIPLVEIPDEGVYEIYQDPSDVGYYPEVNGGNNFASSNYDKYESVGKQSYIPVVSRPKRQTQGSSGSTSAQNENRLTTFINGLGVLSNNLRRQTSEALRSALTRQPTRAFVPPASSQQQVTSLNDVYGATLGARKRTRRSANQGDSNVRQTFAAVIDFDGPVAIRSAVERSDVVPQIAFFETPAAKGSFRLLEEPPFKPIPSTETHHSVAKRSAQQQEEQRQFGRDPFADLFGPLQEIFGIVNATTRAVFRDLIPSQQTSSRPSKFQAISKHEFKLNDREGIVVNTEARPTPEGPMSATIKTVQTFYDPEKEKYETATHESTIMAPVFPPFFGGPLMQNLDPSRLGETIERIAVPFQRAFTNFTTELGLSIFRATHPSTETLVEQKSADASTQASARKPENDVTLGFFRPEKKKKDKTVKKPTSTAVFKINEDNIYPPKNEASNAVLDEVAVL